MKELVLSNTTDKLTTIFQIVWEKDLLQVVFKSKTQDNFAKKCYLVSAQISRFQHMDDGRNFYYIVTSYGLIGITWGQLSVTLLTFLAQGPLKFRYLSPDLVRRG